LDAVWFNATAASNLCVAWEMKHQGVFEGGEVKSRYEVLKDLVNPDNEFGR
jgi:hypothetical protein